MYSTESRNLYDIRIDTLVVYTLGIRAIGMVYDITQIVNHIERHRNAYGPEVYFSSTRYHSAVTSYMVGWYGINVIILYWGDV